MANKTTYGMLPLPSLIRASAWDAGNNSMRAGGRSKWSVKDYNAAASTQNKLIADCFGEGPVGCIKFSIAEAMQRAGILTIGMKAKDFFAAIDAAYAAA